MLAWILGISPWLTIIPIMIGYMFIWIVITYARSKHAFDMWTKSTVVRPISELVDELKEMLNNKKDDE